ncbi:hypothetical protein BHM03_00060937 [Ensete ventricosum]|nr:hypothetical protein BHM03_00060937 [Ensete ventricosum]
MSRVPSHFHLPMLEVYDGNSNPTEHVATFYAQMTLCGTSDAIMCFHRDYMHDTEECYDLKNQIEDLIHHGHLDRYVRKPHEPSLHPKGLVEHHIYVIVGGPAASGISSSTRKTYAYPKVQKRP